MGDDKRYHHFVLPQSIHSRSRLCKEIILLFSAFFLPGIVVQSQAFSREMFAQLGFNIQVLVQAVPQILLLLFVLEIQGDGSLRGLGLDWKRRRVLPVVLAGSVGLFVLANLVGYIAQLAGTGVADGATAVTGTSWNLTDPAIIPMLLLSSIAIGYREELFFRAYLIMRLDQLGAAPAVTVILSALLFSVGHLYEGVTGALVALASGAFLALIYRRGRNLHQVALSHAVYNFVVLVLSGTVGRTQG
jgi:uncharacterized protein